MPRPKTAAARTALAAIYPTTFELDHPKPFKVGMRDDLLTIFPDMDAQTVQRLLGWLTNRRAYLLAIARGGYRFDLDGNACGEIAEAESINALDRFHERNERAKDKWKMVWGPRDSHTSHRAAAE